MAQDRVLGEQIDVVDLSGDLAANPTAIGNLATGITNDPGATATLDVNYVRRDGSTSMSGILTVNNNIVVTGTVDGRDVALDGTTQDSHIADTSLHFAVASINHQSITGVGTNTHSSIDTHIGDATFHFTEASISHANIQNVGTNTHTAIDVHIADDTKHRIINDVGTLTTELFSASKIISDLSSKSDTSHSHSIEDLTNVVVTGSPAVVTNEILRFDGANWVNSSDTGILSLIEDTTPQLGGDLDINGFDITTGTANGSELSLSDIGTILRGANVTGATGGPVSIFGGTSTSTTAGGVTVVGGQGVNGGDVSIGGGYGTTGTGGHVYLSGGNAPNGAAGNILIQPGEGTGGIAGTVIIGSSDGGTGSEVSLIFKEDSANGTNFVALKSPASLTADRTWTLPQDDPALVDGRFLKTDASGVLSFAVVDINLIEDLTPQLGGNLSVNNYTITAESPASATSAGNQVQITATDGGATSGNGGAINITSGNSIGSASGEITIKTGSALSTGGNITLELGYGTATGNVIIASSDATGSYRPSLRFLEASSNGSEYVALRGPTTITTSRAWILPQDDPVTVAGQFLTTDISGNLSFAAVENLTVDNFTDTTDYTSGTTTQLTLSVDPGTENNLLVIFDGVVQHHDQYSVAGTTLTFTATIPSGTNNVEIVIGTKLSIGTPSDATVTNAKLASDVVKSHGGRITTAGATTVASAGLTITKPGTGSYLVTHNWGHINYAPTATVDGTGVYVTIGVVGTNTFEVKTFADGTTTATDAGFTFNVSEW